ncbi:MAG: dihydroorotate dehydrogenase B catalytic subunit [Chloroflexi bacterium B3_Chlor]|nr:MAG: dihydroorotate dehydrogenase B catalytic subunit [Chloroflexi bacterium B3_Chlor]
MTDPDLSVEFCGVRLRNPLVLAAGILGTGAQLLARVAENGAGMVTTKSCGPSPREGHPNPTVLDWGHGLINAVGLANPGVDEGVKIIARAKEILEPLGLPLAASIFAETVKGFAQVARKIADAQPDFIELNISCPNVSHEFGRPFACDAGDAARVTGAVKEVTSIPIIVKLSPNVTDIALIARSVEQAGADAIAAINTLGPGMIIDIYSGQPVLANRVGGVSGPAIRPVAVRCVYDIYEAVEIPIIGIGGVGDGRDALEMVMAGATAVGVGSAVRYGGLEVFQTILEEMRAFMVEEGHTNLNQLRGIAHR